MSRVYLAVARGLGDFNKLHVIKRLLPNLAADPEFLQMFLEEARLSARLNHSNIVQVNEVGFDGAHYFMAMEYLEGQSLDVVIRQARAAGEFFPTEMQLRVIADACTGLHHAHELADIDGAPMNIVHRDVSPHNVFVTYTGQVKVLDFGIAKAADSQHHTRTGIIKGKCAYMAPEQFRAGKIDRRADIFALGAMVWHAATQVRLWKGMTDFEIFQALADGEIPSPLTINPYAPPQLVSICERALAPELSHRFGTAAELGEAIEGYLATLPKAPERRDISRYVGDRFAETRARVKAAIEQELRRGHELVKNTGDIPVFFDPDMPSSDDSSSPAPMQAVPELPAAKAPTPSVAAPARARGVALAMKFFAGTLAVGALVIASFLFFRSRQRAAPPQIDNAQAHVEAAGQPKDQAGGEFTVLAVRVNPETAAVLVDEVPLSSNPATARFYRDNLAHRVRAEASGYKGHAEVVVYDDVTKNVSFSLERDPNAAPATIVSTRRARGSGGRVPAASASDTDEAPAVVAPPPPPPPPPPKATSNKPALDKDPWSTK